MMAVEPQKIIVIGGDSDLMIRQYVRTLIIEASESEIAVPCYAIREHVGSSAWTANYAVRLYNQRMKHKSFEARYYQRIRRHQRKFPRNRGV